MQMAALGFVLNKYPLAVGASPGNAAYKGRMLTYQRHSKRGSNEPLAVAGFNARVRAAQSRR